MLAELLRSSRYFRWARRTAQGLEELAANNGRPQSPVVDATWDYVENVTNIFVKGDLGSDEAVRELLDMLPVQSPIPIGEQVRVTKALHRAMQLSTLRQVATEATPEEITRACDELVSVVMGYLVMMDAAPYLGGRVPEPVPPLLCAVFELDPSFLASIGLLVAAIKRDPEIGEELTSWLDATCDLISYLVRVVLGEVGERVPELQAVALRYFGNRVGRELLLTAPDDDPPAELERD